MFRSVVRGCFCDMVECIIHFTVAAGYSSCTLWFAYLVRAAALSESDLLQYNLQIARYRPPQYAIDTPEGNNQSRGRTPDIILWLDVFEGCARTRTPTVLIDPRLRKRRACVVRNLIMASMLTNCLNVLSLQEWSNRCMYHYISEIDLGLLYVPHHRGGVFY